MTRVRPWFGGSDETVERRALEEGTCVVLDRVRNLRYSAHFPVRRGESAIGALGCGVDVLGNV